MMNVFKAAALALLMTPGLAFSQEVADTIYSDGSILTINESASSAEAVAVRSGRIIAVGSMV